MLLAFGVEMKNYIKCPNCKTENKLEEGVPVEEQMCKKCWHFLHEPSSSAPPKAQAKTPKYAPSYKGFGESRYKKDRVRPVSSFPLGWLVAVILLGLWLLATNQNDNKMTQLSAQKSSAKVLPMPRSGMTAQDFTTEALANFTLTASKDNNHYVKLESAKNQAVIATYFIKAGESIITKVPLGQYRIKVASGRNWFGEALLFGVRTELKKSDNIFTFSQKGSQIVGQTITFNARVNGNMPTSRIHRNDF